MFVELIETLRCPAAHPESQLVASATRTENRHIMDGTLGCPVCGAETLVRDGAALFDAAATRAPRAEGDVEGAMRLAAFLELTDARGFALLCGTQGAFAAPLYQFTETPLVLLNPPEGADSRAVAGVLLSVGAVPLAAGSARAAALDSGMSDTLVQGAVRAVRAGGRVVAPGSVPLPAGVTELVRDERVWVGQKTAAAPDPAPRLVTLARGRR